MKILHKIFDSLKKIIHWYKEPIQGYRLYRVDPITVSVLAFLVFVGTYAGVATTTYGVIRGLDIEKEADEVADALRNAEVRMRNVINDSYQSNNLSGYEYEVALGRLDALGPIFNQYADIIDNKGNWEAEKSLIIGMAESVFSFNPTGYVLRFQSDLHKLGKLMDHLISFACSSRTMQNLKLFNNPFSEEEELLRKAIDEVFDVDADEFFKARMRAKINILRQNWVESIKKNPCPGNKEKDEYRTWASVKVSDWAEHPVRLYGGREKWSTYDDFLDWMIDQAQGEGLITITRDYSGNFELDRSPTKDCTVCVPPWFSGEIKLSVDLVTCKVTGEINGGGEGEGAKTDNCSHGVKNPCSGQGKIEFDGVIDGSADNAGLLTLDPTNIQVRSNITWREGCNIAAGVYNRTWVDNITISGTIDWNEYIQGEINYPVSGCGSVGNFTLLYQENPYGY